MGKPTDLVQGTLDFLILRTLEQEPKHGWAIGKRIEQLSDDVLQIPQGSLYPALYRLERQGFVTGKTGRADNGREVKFYALTKAGRKHLKKEVELWGRLSNAINVVIHHA